MPDAEYSSLRSLGARARWIVIGAFAAGFLFAIANAAIAPFWFDELLTFYVSRLGGPTQIWAALENTADGQPPLSYLFTLFFHRLLGETEFATRLPSLLALAIATYAFFFWIAERIGALHGVIATGFLWTTLVFQYSFEARPYALLTACVVLSLLLWRRACEGQGRRGALLGLACVVAVAMGSHYYAIFSLFPLGAGELARTWRRRKFDLPFWLALAIGSATVLLYLPLIEGARQAYQEGFWSPVRWGHLATFYFECLKTSGLSLLAYPFLIAVNWNTAQTPTDEKTMGNFPFEETVAMWALTLSPPLAVLAVMWTTDAYVFRYSLPAALGLAWLYAIFTRGCAHGRPRTAWIVMGIVAASFVFQGTRRGADLVNDYRRGFLSGSTFASMEKLKPAPHLPIAVTSPFDYLTFHYYAPEPWRSRLVYLSDAERCLSVTNINTPEVALNLFKEVASLRIEQRPEYLSRGQDFLVLHIKDVVRPPDCKKFEAKNLLQLHETNAFFLYRWRAAPETGINDDPLLQGKRVASM